MIGIGLKKLASENNMTVASGVAYGDLHGYAATLSEGAGYKLLVITTNLRIRRSSMNLLYRMRERIQW